LPKCSARSFHHKVAEQIPQALRVALVPILEIIASLTERIRDYDRKLEKLAGEHYPETELLRQVVGVGALTALTFVLTLEDPRRFAKSRSVGAYSLGLVPGKDQSGERDPQERISKEGDEMLRRLLVGSAHYILGPFGRDSDLRRHGLKIASRGAKRTQRNERRWPWLANSRCSYTSAVDHGRALRAALQHAAIRRPDGLGPTTISRKRRSKREEVMRSWHGDPRAAAEVEVARSFRISHKATAQADLVPFLCGETARKMAASVVTRSKTDLIMHRATRSGLTESADGSMTRVAEARMVVAVATSPLTTEAFSWKSVCRSCIAEVLT
jgi:hypothetical protein